MQRNGLLVAAAAALVLALLAANSLSDRGAPQPGDTAPEAITAPHGDPPPPIVSPDAPPGRTPSAPQGEAPGR